MEKSSLTTGLPVTHSADRKRASRRGRWWRKFVKGLLDNMLLVSTIVGVFVGFGLGFAVRTTHPSEDALMWLGEDYLFYAPNYLGQLCSLLPKH